MTGDAADLRKQALSIFDQVVELEVDVRESRLEALCAGDAALRSRVEAMLAADASATEPFEGDADAWAEAMKAAAGTGDAPDAQAPPGEQIGAWRVVGLLGRGGMGAVYAVERADGAYVQQAALKRVHGGEIAASARERFLRERQVLARLQHPHIATLLDGGFDDAGDPYFVMERVDGVAIDRWCDEQRLGLRERVRLFLQVLDAVQYAHRNLVVHRDLKPSNLLVTRAGQVKLLDFGIARELEQAGLAATATSDRAMTLQYASPEQLHNQPITTATDLYQLGVVLYRLLAGTHPFGIEADTPLARQLQALSQDPEPITRSARHADAGLAAQRGETPGSLARALDGGLEAVVHACLRRNPAERYASAETLGNDLRAWLDDRPVSAARPGRGARMRLWLRRNRALAASAAAIALALFAGTGVALWQAREAREQARIAEREGANAREALAFLTDTLAAASPEQAMDTDVSVRELLDRAREQLDLRGVVDPQVRQPVQRMLGSLYGALGDAQSARSLFESGLEGVAPRSRDEALVLADDWVGYSDTLTALERVQESRAAGDRAAALRREWAPDDPRQQFLALAHISYGDYVERGPDACEAQLRQALALADGIPGLEPGALLDALSTLAGIHTLKGDQASRIEVAQQGLDAIERHRLPPQSPYRIAFLRFKGEGLADSGRPAEAEPVLREAIALQARTGSRGTSPLVLYNALGKAQAMLGNYRDAMASFGLAAAPQAAVGPAAIAEGGVLANLAMVHAWAGDHPGALERFDRAISIMEAGKVPQDEGYRRAYERNRAMAWALAGRHAQARSELERLRERARLLDGEDAMEYLQTTLRLALVARLEGDPGRGEPLLHEAQRLLAAHAAPTSPLFLAALRTQAAFARMRGDLAGAEHTQREALARAESGQNRFELAAVQAELAAIRFERGDREQAHQLLQQALPVLREAVLPQQGDRADAEALARQLDR